MNPIDAVNEIAKACDGKITEVGILPDNSGFAIMETPLRADHWLYGDRSMERKVCEGPDGEDVFHEPPPMPLRMGRKDMIAIEVGHRRDVLDRDEMADMIRMAGKYAVRCATMKGKEMDFEPDALLQNLVVGFLGYWTGDGLTGTDEWANPERVRRSELHAKWCCEGNGRGGHAAECRYSQPRPDDGITKQGSIPTKAE